MTTPRVSDERARTIGHHQLVPISPLVARELCDDLLDARARITELEAVVRAGDEMRRLARAKVVK